MNKETADYINILGQFCGIRDVPELSQKLSAWQVQVPTGGCYGSFRRECPLRQ